MRSVINQPKAPSIFSSQEPGIIRDLRESSTLKKQKQKNLRLSTNNSYRWGRKDERNSSKAFQTEQDLHVDPKAWAGLESKEDSPTMYKPSFEL